MRIIKPSVEVISFGESPFGIQRPAATFEGILDTLTATPYMAYSTRRLSSTYTGFCMRVRNTITTTVYDLPFGSDGWVDVSALTQAQLHEVQIWYDQSGNARNGVQLGGNPLSVVRFGGAPSSRHSVALHSTTVRYINLGDLSALTAGEMHYVTKAFADPSSAGTGRAWTLGTSGESEHIPFTDGNIYDDFGSTTRVGRDPDETSLANWHLYTHWSASADRAIYLNGASFYETATNTVGFPASSYLNGDSDGRDAAEFILFSETLSSPDRSALFTDVGTAFSLF